MTRRDVGAALWTAAFFLYVPLDVGTTWLAVSVYGATEGNPVARWLLVELGYWPVVGIKLLAFSGVIIAAILSDDDDLTWLYVPLGFALVALGVVILNTLTLVSLINTHHP